MSSLLTSRNRKTSSYGKMAAKNRHSPEVVSSSRSCIIFASRTVAPSTRKTYSSASKIFHAFCVKFNIPSPFPVSEHTLCCFAAYLAEEGLAPQTAKTYLSAVRNLKLSMGLPYPRDQSSLPILKRVLAGIARSRLTRWVPLRVRLPITAPILAQLHGNLTQSSRPDRVLIWAVAATAFFGFFRLGELLVDAPKNYSPATDLSWGDVSVDDRASPTMVKIHLRQSKCDQFGKGVEVIIGRTDTSTCPIAALTTYIFHRQDIPGAFFLTKEGSPATKSWFVDQIREILSSIGRVTTPGTVSGLVRPPQQPWQGWRILPYRR